MTAKDFLYQYLEYRYLWSDHSASSKPGKIRKERLLAFMKAFGLTDKPQNFVTRVRKSVSSKKEDPLFEFQTGLFIESREPKLNQEMKEKVLKYADQNFGLKDLPETYHDRADLSWLFNNLLLFRLDLFKVAYPDGGMLEGFSSGLMYSKVLKKEIKDLINDHLDEIDSTLCQLIAPQNRDFSIEKLVSEYKYPEADLEQLERDYLMENY